MWTWPESYYANKESTQALRTCPSPLQTLHIVANAIAPSTLVHPSALMHVEACAALAAVSVYPISRLGITTNRLLH